MPIAGQIHMIARTTDQQGHRDHARQQRDLGSRDFSVKIKMLFAPVFLELTTLPATTQHPGRDSIRRAAPPAVPAGSGRASWLGAFNDFFSPFVVLSRGTIPGIQNTEWAGILYRTVDTVQYCAATTCSILTVYTAAAPVLHGQEGNTGESAAAWRGALVQQPAAGSAGASPL